MIVLPPGAAGQGGRPGRRGAKEPTMQTAALRRTVLFLLLLGAVLLVPGAALAAPPAHQTPGQPGLLQSLRGWLTALWSGEGSAIDPYGNRAGDRLVPFWDQEGSDIDPFGNHGTNPAPPPATDHQDAGSAIDPFGAH
jgi:hypothetical protein